MFKWNQESWLSLVGQAGSSLLEGDQLQVTDTGGETLVFRFFEAPYTGTSPLLENGNLVYPVIYNDSMTAVEVLSVLAEAINAEHVGVNGLPVAFAVQAQVANQRLELTGDSAQPGEELVFQLAAGSDPNRDAPVSVHPFAMKPAEVHLDEMGL
ncbi:MAG: hypothetical protein GY917_03705, partial [Planctomycetaceae bacterium]|nr:hypothetical protein [Planctomycetaceae bacterium]